MNSPLAWKSWKFSCLRFFSDTSSLAVQCSVGTYVVASCVCISANFRVLFACGRGHVCGVGVVLGVLLVLVLYLEAYFSPDRALHL